MICYSSVSESELRSQVVTIQDSL